MESSLYPLVPPVRDRDWNRHGPILGVARQDLGGRLVAATLIYPAIKQNPTTHHSTFVFQLVSFERERDLEGLVLDADGGRVVPFGVTHLSIAEVDKFSEGMVSEIKISSVTVESSKDDRH